MIKSGNYSYSMKELIDLVSSENVFVSSNFFFENLSAGTRYRMGLYGRVYSSTGGTLSCQIDAGGLNSYGTPYPYGRSYSQPAFLRFYSYASSIVNNNTEGF